MRVEWTPSLTFGMRRIELADWLDQHVLPVSLLDEPERIGLAVERPDLRVTVGRRSMLLSSGASGGELDALAPVMDGVFEVLRPRDAVVSLVSTLCTAEIGGQEYDEAASYFARHAAAAQVVVGGLRPLDASALMDLESPTHHVQVEWGVVDPDQLLSRLANPSVGRIDATARAGVLGEEELQARLHSGLPDVALLAEVTHSRRRGGKVSSSADVLSSTKELSLVAEEITRDLLEGLWPTGRTQRELA